MRAINAQSRISMSAFLFAVYCALAPANMVMNFTGSTINRYVGLLVAAALGIRLLKTKEMTVNMKIVLPLFLYLIWTLITCFWTIDIYASTSSTITHLSLVGIFLFGTLVGFNASEIRFIKAMIVLLAAALTFYIVPAVGSDTPTRATLQTAAGIADQNGLAANMVFALWIAIDQIREARRFWTKILYGAAIILISYSMLVIASRGALVGFLMAALLYFVIFRAYRIRPAVLILVVIAGVLVYQYALQKNPVAMRRLSIAETISDGGTGRSVTWPAIWELLLEHPVRLIVGYGYGCEGAVGLLARHVWIGTHNVYLELLATTGVVGVVLFLVFIGSIALDAVKRKDYLGVAVVIVFMAVCFVLGFSKDKGAWNMLLLTTVGFDHNQYTSANMQNRKRGIIEKDF